MLFFIIALALVVALPFLPGFGSPAFQGISVFLGVLLSLGSSAAVANIVAGIILIYTRAFRVGDRIKINDAIGDIVEKSLFVTQIRTTKNVVITIPNGTVLTSQILNYSALAEDPNHYLILHTTVTLGYDLPWRKVHQVLINAALATPHILAEPVPFILQTSLGDFYVNYEINGYTNQPKSMARIYSELHQNIQDKCNEADIEILSPHYSAIRDGNQITIPENYLHKDYKAPGFRVSPLDHPLNQPNGKNSSET
ncbi:MAG: mechanosensitive ion channel family protein [Rhizonema sp. NSF051]|nr:mechanosensitive ion channel family protein [Rhizonema sp. NSF051]